MLVGWYYLVIMGWENMGAGIYLHYTVHWQNI